MNAKCHAKFPMYLYAKSSRKRPFLTMERRWLLRALLDDASSLAHAIATVRVLCAYSQRLWKSLSPNKRCSLLHVRVCTLHFSSNIDDSDLCFNAQKMSKLFFCYLTHRRTAAKSTERVSPKNWRAQKGEQCQSFVCSLFFFVLFFQCSRIAN